jgi:deoxyxylulose-5-phosphate synthase
MSSMEYAYDAKLEVVVRVVAKSREEADDMIRDVLCEEQPIAMRYPNGVLITAGTVNEMPVHFETVTPEEGAVA